MELCFKQRGRWWSWLLSPRSRLVTSGCGDLVEQRFKQRSHDLPLFISILRFKHRSHDPSLCFKPQVQAHRSHDILFVSIFRFKHTDLMICLLVSILRFKHTDLMIFLFVSILRFKHTDLMIFLFVSILRFKHTDLTIFLFVSILRFKHTDLMIFLFVSILHARDARVCLSLPDPTQAEMHIWEFEDWHSAKMTLLDSRERAPGRFGFLPRQFAFGGVMQIVYSGGDDLLLLANLHLSESNAYQSKVFAWSVIGMMMMMMSARAAWEVAMLLPLQPPTQYNSPAQFLQACHVFSNTLQSFPL